MGKGDEVKVFGALNGDENRANGDQHTFQHVDEERCTNYLARSAQNLQNEQDFY